MIRVIIRSYDVLAEVALWVLLIVATAIGYFQAGVAGALIGFGVSFVFSVMAFAPILMISDMRGSLKSIDASLKKSARSAVVATAPASVGPSAQAKDRREPSFGKPAAAGAHQGPVLRARPVTPNPED